MRRAPSLHEKPFPTGSQGYLRVEVAEDKAFQRVVTMPRTRVLAEADWICRIMVGNLEPAHIYWYRFIDSVWGHRRSGACAGSGF